MNELYPHISQRVPSPAGNSDAIFGAPPLELGEETEGLDLRDCWRVIKKHRRLITFFLPGVMLTTVAVLFTMSPFYTANTTILIERHDPQVVDIKQVLSEPLGPDEHDYYKTQYEILRSRSLAAEVIREQGLEKNGLFTGEGQKGVVGTLLADATAWLKQLVPSSSKSSAENLLGAQSMLVDRYINDILKVEPINGTRLAKISFSTLDPNLSARLANAHTEVYIRRGLKLRSEASREARKFLEEKLVELKERVENSEAALNSYRRDKGIIALDDKENIVVERLADLNKKLTEAEVERITLEAQVHLIRRRDYHSLPAVIGSSLISTLKEQLTRLQGEYASLSAQFKPGYPRLAQVKANLQEVQHRLQQEIQKIVAGIESVFLAAETKEKDLRAKTEQQKAAALELKDASVNYAILAREAETNRQLYDSVLGRIKEISVTAELPNSNVFVIDSAQPPVLPSSPKMKLNLLLSALVGLLGGLGLAFLLEHLDKTFKTPEEAERYLSLPNLGLVPDFLIFNRRSLARPALALDRGVQRKRDRVSGFALGSPPVNSRERRVVSFHPSGLIGEAYRTLRTAILLSHAGEPPRTVLFTSATHGEGKTATAVNSAITFAQMGVRVLLIDADLRRPSCHKILGLARGVGVAELLSGQIELARAIQSTSVDHLFFISSGSTAPNPTELVGSQKMRETLLLARQHYDYILVDSPPVMAVSDAVLLSTMADGVVLVIGGRDTPRNVVKQACSRLRYARAKILGMVLNRVDARKQGYPDYYYPSDSYSDARIKKA